jgi:alpha-amylase
MPSMLRSNRHGASSARAHAALLSLALLAGCGGGGGSDTPAIPPTIDAASVSAVAASDPGSALPAHWQRGVFMEIFVRAYQDSNGDGIGDLKGLTSRLDDLKELGITGLWLMPIHPSQDRDHGYAVTDYRAIAPEYGTLADLDELLRQAHARGIGVVIDYVMNHSAAAHPLFANSRSAADNPRRDWYVWQNPAPPGWTIYGSNPWHGAGSNGGSGVGSYFGGFWSQMPDFNLKNTRVAEWHRDNLRFWLNRGVDGFRFDAVGNLVENGPSAWENQPENHALMASVQGVLAGYARRYLVCEAPGQPRRYAEADSCGSAFAFGQQYDIVSAAKGDTAAIARVAAYRSTASDTLAGFASNHDGFAGERLWDQLGGDVAKMRLAAATYLLSSPTAFVYYGEEIGMAGASGLSGDPKLRTPMSWTPSTTNAGFTTGRPFRELSANVASANVAAQRGNPASLRSFYRDVIALRQTLPALTLGRYAGAQAQDTRMQFRRVLTTGKGTDTVWVGFNYGNRAATLDLADLPAGMTLRRHWPAGAGDVTLDTQGRATVTLPAGSFAVLQAVQAP